MNTNIPDYQSLMLPLLTLLADKNEYTAAVAVDKLSDKFHLSQEEREELLPSGAQAIIANRVAWAKFYLERAGLLKTVKRGVYTITDEGLKLLEKKADRIDVAYLKTIPRFKKWYAENSGSKKVKSGENILEEKVIDQTPDEQILEAYKKINEELVFNILEKLKSPAVTAAKFEKIVVDLLVAMGYGGPDKDGKAIGKSSDGGVDGVIKEDKLGLDMIYVQAKKWNDAVTISSVRDFAGALLSKKAKKGVFITTSTFPKSAYQFTESIEPKIILIDGEQLANYMIAYQVGVSVKQTLKVKRLDTDYFEEY